ncbi:TPA: hypothetical protein QFT03_001077 [Kluyvera ascorbata]|uniref:hypothetical protein n=1 Tax=Kluyvera sp. CRP TaxID=2873269 RepID=UPI0013D5748C|nr:hypothetical protein [Kluyvera sp. CRP]UAK22534.1 hypothetical protein K7B04_11975 [Kluyvera sp. CRP]HDT6544150.1 hypothetical protein [Kluyvera ascorbata]
MPLYLSTQFDEFRLDNGLLAHLFKFSVQHHHFILVFSPIDISDEEYHQFRNEEVGFVLPADCYDVKFDRQVNFESGDFYAPPLPGECSRRFGFANELAEALKAIIQLHYATYRAKAYLAIAENDKLKRYYDRILQTVPGDVVYELIQNVGVEGRGYAFKTRCFNT